MHKFYLQLWFFWFIRVFLFTISLAIATASLITLFIYMKKGFVPLDAEVSAALFAVWKFWFFLSVNITLLLSLFLTLKYSFNRCYGGYMLRLKACTEESHAYKENLGYGDLIRVWRKWFMLLIWLVGALMIITFVLIYLFTSFHSLFEWFSIYLLYFFIFISGYFSFLFMGARCKNVKIVKC